MKHALDEDGRSHLVAVIDEGQKLIRISTTSEGKETGGITLPLRVDILRFLKDLLVVLGEIVRE